MWGNSNWDLLHAGRCVKCTVSMTAPSHYPSEAPFRVLSFENASIPKSVNHYPYASKLSKPCLEFLSSRLVFSVTIEDLKWVV